MSENNLKCQFVNSAGEQCGGVDNGSGFCFWHDENCCKNGSDIKQRLEDYAKSGGMLCGISLKQADLSNIDLVNHHHKNGYDFSQADLYKVNLSGAHLFNINFSETSLMKADLRGANLNWANLDGANLLGVKWKDCKIEHLRLGEEVKQEREARQAIKNQKRDLAIDLFGQSEEIYRDLRKHAEREGIFTMSGAFIQKELTMRRMQMRPYSLQRMTSKVVDLFCGYGEEPLRIVGLSIGMIILCAFLYTLTGLNYQGDLQIFDSNATIGENLNLFLSCLYYSVVTFTTLGYGDFTPVGASRAIAAFEAFSGSFTIALFVVVFVKKMTR
ncbi:pentapeptide repeat-containing protein [Alteromonadaceae bacterium M269]|nr:pentapeptide repeat-containing protein [Alteromonadaceae bacterium M269]